MIADPIRTSRIRRLGDQEQVMARFTQVTTTSADGVRSRERARWSGSRLTLLVSGSMIVAVQAWKLIAPGTLIDPNGFPATARSWIQLLAYILLTAAALNLYRHPRMRRGPVARVAGAIAFAGTALVAGDAWFEAVMYPMAVAHDPTLPSASPTTPWLIGILVTFGTFAIGWCATGVLLARRRLVKPAAGWFLMVAALVAYLPLMTPFAIPLGCALSVCALTAKFSDPARGDDTGGLPAPAEGRRPHGRDKRGLRSASG